MNMWKREQREVQGSAIPSIPLACEPSVNRPPPQSSTTFESGSFSISSRPAFGRKGTGDVLKELPGLPYVHSSLILCEDLLILA